MKQSLFFSAVAVALLLFVGCSKENLGDNQDQGNQLKTNYYQCWTNGGGTVKCTNGSGGNYKVAWTKCGNFVAGKGYSGFTGTLSYSGSCSGCQRLGIYGWCTGPLIEYYIGRSGGTSKGTYSTSKGTYTLYIQSCNGPNIQGSGPFKQYNCSGSGGSGANISQHRSGWAKLGQSTGSPNYCIAATEGWGGSSGSANVTVN